MNYSMTACWKVPSAIPSAVESNETRKLILIYVLRARLGRKGKIFAYQQMALEGNEILLDQQRKNVKSRVLFLSCHWLACSKLIIVSKQFYVDRNFNLSHMFSILAACLAQRRCNLNCRDFDGHDSMCGSNILCNKKEQSTTVITCFQEKS